MSQDVGPILREWDENPEVGSIRKIIGQDGNEKIQVRVEFGLLQMEMDGRPDGKKTYGKESLLEHYLSLLDDYVKEYEESSEFKLDSYDCERLRDESLQYYQRYVIFFELKDYERAERDTSRNLRLLDLMKKHAENQDDALSFEKYRPYIVMMNSRAKAYIKMANEEYLEAISVVEEAIEAITDFFKDNEFDEESISASQELAILREMTRDIRNKWEG